MREKTRISPKYMLLLVLATFIFSLIYYFIGAQFINSPLSYYQYLIFTSMVAVVIVQLKGQQSMVPAVRPITIVPLGH